MFQVVPVDPSNAELLGTLFEQLVEDENHFHPHPLTMAEAWSLAHRETKNVHLVALFENQAVAYGLLRGWDEGYKAPSLGVAVAREFRGRGLGRMMMEVLHTCAKLRGAQEVRLKVYATNKSAKTLYESLGYTWIFDEDETWISDEVEQLVGLLKFS